MQPDLKINDEWFMTHFDASDFLRDGGGGGGACESGGKF